MSQKQKKTLKKTIVKTDLKPSKKIVAQKKMKVNTTLFWALGIIILTFLLYLPVLKHDFVNWDDDRYVTDNPFLKDLSWQSIKYYFTNFYFSMYLPITMLTYLIDHYFAGFEPWLYHFTNLLFHTINTGLVFWFIYQLCKLAGISRKLDYAILVSALFGLHTIHVESVAWIAERKDVVYTAFFISSLIAYLKYFEKQKAIYYIISLFLLLISLISKAQAMTLFVILVAIDYLLKRNLLNKKLILEKIPFFILSAIFGYLAIKANRAEGTTSNINYTFMERMVFASYSYITYIVKMIVPFNLSVIYPYPDKVNETIPLEYLIYILPTLLIVATFCYSIYKKWNELAFGIAFFTVNISLVLQFFAYHNFIMADRYSYVSSIGVFFIIPFLFRLASEKKPAFEKPLMVILAGYIIFLCIYTHTRQKDWKDSITLWNDLKIKYPNVIISYYNSGTYWMKKNNLKEAIKEFDLTIQKKSDHIGALSNRGISLAQLGNVNGALEDFNKVVKIDSTYNNVYSNRGNVKVMLNDLPGAIEDYSKAILLNPTYVDALYNRGLAYSKVTQWNLAVEDLNKVIQLQPEHANAYYSRGIALSNLNKTDEVLQDFNAALRYDPKMLDAIFGIALIKEKQGNINGAIQDYSKIISLNPKLPIPYYKRGYVLVTQGKNQQGCQDLKTALELGFKPAEDLLKKYCLK